MIARRPRHEVLGRTHALWVAVVAILLAEGCNKEPGDSAALKDRPQAEQPAPPPKPTIGQDSDQEAAPDPVDVQAPSERMLDDHETARDPLDTPRFSPDGQFVAFLLWEPEKDGRMPQTAARSGLIYDFAQKKTLPFFLPKSYRAEGLLWCGNTLVVRSLRRLTKDQFQGAPWRFDPPSNSLKPVTLEFRGWPYEQFELPVGSGMRLRLIFSETDALTSLDMGDKVMWLKEAELRNGTPSHPVVPKAVQILDRVGEVVAEVSVHETPTRARISEDRRLLLLVTGPHEGSRGAHDSYSFGVFDLMTGTRRYGRSCGDLRGIPALVDGRVFSIEPVRQRFGIAPQDPPTLALVAHGPQESKEVLRIVLRPGESASRFSVSVAQDRLALQVDGTSPRLLVMPLRDDARLSDLLEIRP